MKYQYVFGPVPSRRLGLSLGVDLAPFKTCPANCIYCECGATTHLTIRRREWFPTQAVLDEVDKVLSPGPQLDYVTFSGSGEPTLHSGLGAVADHIKTRHPAYRLALLTNGLLFWDAGVRRDAARTDLVIASVDAGSQEVFTRINRPHPSLKLEEVIRGLERFRAEFCGELWIEVFLASGVNDSPGALHDIQRAVARVNPDKVQINTLDRPGTETWVQAASPEALSRAMDILKGAEIIAKASARALEAGGNEDAAGRILSTIRRRPCTVEDMARALGMHEAHVRKHLAALSAEGKVAEERLPRGVFYRAAAP